MDFGDFISSFSLHFVKRSTCTEPEWKALVELRGDETTKFTADDAGDGTGTLINAVPKRDLSCNQINIQLILVNPSTPKSAKNQIQENS